VEPPVQNDDREFVDLARPMRLRRKTSPLEIQAAVGDITPFDECLPDDLLRDYMITLPHPKRQRTTDGYAIVAPGQFSKRQIMDKLLDSFNAPVNASANGTLSPPVPLAQGGIWREWHEMDEDGNKFTHDHACFKACRTFRYVPVKRALLQRHGLVSHWSRHPGYWSMVRYLAVPSPKKPKESLDRFPLLWSSTGNHPPIIDCINAPVTAKATETKRLKLMEQAAQTIDRPHTLSSSTLVNTAAKQWCITSGRRERSCQR